MGYALPHPANQADFRSLCFYVGWVEQSVTHQKCDNKRRYWEHTLRDEEDWKHHMDYIHYNPVKHRHVERDADWPYSTFHRYVGAGIYPKDWGGRAGMGEGKFGEV